MLNVTQIILHTARTISIVKQNIIIDNLIVWNFDYFYVNIFEIFFSRRYNNRYIFCRFLNSKYGGKTDGLADAIAATKYTENIIDFSKILISGENPQRKTEEF